MSSFLKSVGQLNRSGKARGRNASNLENSKKVRHSIQIGKSVAKVRWLESQTPLLVPGAITTEYFVIGSSVLKQNEVSLGQLDVTRSRDEVKTNIQIVHKYPVNGSVTDLVSIGDDSFALATSEGAISLFKIIQSHSIENCAAEGLMMQIKSMYSRPLFSYRQGISQCPATSLAISGISISTVGEDGSIYELSLATGDVVQALEQVDPLSLHAVEYIGRSTIACGNGGGQVKIFDLRTHTSKVPTQVLNHLSELSSAISIAQHPTQSYVLVVGYQSGSMDLWDIRQTSNMEPTANLPSEDGGVSEIYFHEINPDNFLTCSQSGELNHWFPSDANGDLNLVQRNDYNMDLNIEFLKHGLSVKKLYSSSFPLNSMSLSRRNTLLCAGDSGIVFCSELNL